MALDGRRSQFPCEFCANVNPMGGRMPADRRDAEREAAMAVAIARRLRPPMKVFADEVRREMGLTSLSRRAIYAWERGESRVPAAALLAAAKVSDQSVDQLLERVRRLERMGLLPGE